MTNKTNMSSADSKAARFKEAADHDAAIAGWVDRIIEARWDDDKPAFDKAVMDGADLMRSRPTTADGELVAEAKALMACDDIGFGERLMEFVKRLAKCEPRPAAEDSLVAQLDHYKADLDRIAKAIPANDGEGTADAVERFAAIPAAVQVPEKLVAWAKTQVEDGPELGFNKSDIDAARFILRIHDGASEPAEPKGQDTDAVLDQLLDDLGSAWDSLDYGQDEWQLVKATISERIGEPAEPSEAKPAASSRLVDACELAAEWLEIDTANGGGEVAYDYRKRTGFIKHGDTEPQLAKMLRQAIAAEKERDEDRRWYQPDGSYTLMDSAEDVTARRKWAAGRMEELEVDRDALQMISDGVPALREERDDLKRQLQEAKKQYDINMAASQKVNDAMRHRAEKAEASKRGEREAMQRSLEAMLEAAGLGSHARPLSAADVVMTELVPWMRKKAEASGGDKLRELRAELDADYKKHPMPTGGSFADHWHRYIRAKIDRMLAEPAGKPAECKHGMSMGFCSVSPFCDGAEPADTERGDDGPLRVVTAYHVPHSETVEDHMVVVLEDGSSYTWGNEGWQLHTNPLDKLARGGAK